MYDYYREHIKPFIDFGKTKTQNFNSRQKGNGALNMTEYKLVESMQSDKPLDIDTTSSPNIVYQRKNIKSVEATGSEDDFTYKPKHWEYEERELTQDEYSQYLIAMEQVKEINEHSDEEAIDNYTRQLMDEGVL